MSSYEQSAAGAGWVPRITATVPWVSTVSLCVGKQACCIPGWPFSRRWTNCAGVSGMKELCQYQQRGLCSCVSPRCATAPLSSRPSRPLYLLVCWSWLGRMAREVGGHLALCALQLTQINASLLILGALKVSSAMVLKMAKQQQESVPH